MKVLRGFTRSTSHVRFSGTARKQLAIFTPKPLSVYDGDQTCHVTNDGPRAAESLECEDEGKIIHGFNVHKYERAKYEKPEVKNSLLVFMPLLTMLCQDQTILITQTFTY